MKPIIIIMLIAVLSCCEKKEVLPKCTEKTIDAKPGPVPKCDPNEKQ